MRKQLFTKRKKHMRKAKHVPHALTIFPEILRHTV